MNTWRLIEGDAREQLANLATGSADCIVTSPPYWGLRDYGVAGQIGLEATIAEHLEDLVQVFREARRVLSRRGTLWLNYGDTYSGSRAGGVGETSTIEGTRTQNASRDARSVHPTREEPLRYKSKIGMPWRVAFALMDDGWMLRQEIIWHKPNPMPESCRDRPTTAHEPVFLFSKTRRYYYNSEAAREPVTGTARPRGNGVNPKALKAPAGWDTGDCTHRELAGRYKQNPSFAKAVRKQTDDRNWRSVWTILPEAYKGDHCATMPRELAARCIMAGCPPGGTVLDLFAGTGTSLLVALDHQCDGVGIELSPEYLAIARGRLEKHNPLFAREA